LAQDENLTIHFYKKKFRCTYENKIIKTTLESPQTERLICHLSNEFFHISLACLLVLDYIKKEVTLMHNVLYHIATGEGRGGDGVGGSMENNTMQIPEYAQQWF
jgi:hypothetical protein